MKTTNKLLAAAICMVAFSLTSCDEEAEGTDLMLYNMALDANGHVWYKLSDANLTKSSGSGHNFDYLRTRYNATAATQLDSVGKIKTDAQFPEGSLVVKELYDQPGSVERFAILYKQTGHADADATGWVWGYVNNDGTVRTSATDKGEGCRGCHLQSGNIDLQLMNKFFP